MRNEHREWGSKTIMKDGTTNSANAPGDSNTNTNVAPDAMTWASTWDCGSEDHHVADCTTYKQGMKCLGYTPDEEDMSQTEKHEFYSGLIITIGARCFFDCPLFW